MSLLCSIKAKSYTGFTAFLIFFATTILFTACSSNKLAYNNLDRIIPWYVDDYVSLNKDQKQLLRTFLNEKLSWHRKTQLPQYVQILNAISLDLDKPLTHPQIAAYYADYNRLWNQIIAELVPDIATILSSASETQINQLLMSLRSQNEDLRQQYILPARRDVVELRARATMDQLEHWIKYLTPEQEKSILAWSENLLAVNEQWMYYRLLWQQSFKLALQHRQQGAEFEKLLAQLFLQPDQFWSPLYTIAVRENESRTIDLYVSLFSSLKPDQKRYFLHKLEALRNDLQQLTRDA